MFSVLAPGRELSLPNIGMETVHHVHADDVAQAFMGAIENRSVALGEAFHVVSPAALTLRGYAEAMADCFGQEPRLTYLPWPEWKLARSELEADQAWDHIAHSPNCSIAKSKRLIGYRPHYSSLEAVREFRRLVDREGGCGDRNRGLTSFPHQSKSRLAEVSYVEGLTAFLQPATCG